MSDMNNFLSKNWTIVVWFCALIFGAGSIYSEFTAIKNKADVLDQRLEKKIKVINELETRIIKLEKEVEYEEGYLKGKKEGN